MREGAGLEFSFLSLPDFPLTLFRSRSQALGASLLKGRKKVCLAGTVECLVRWSPRILWPVGFTGSPRSRRKTRACFGNLPFVCVLFSRLWSRFPGEDGTHTPGASRSEVTTCGLGAG